MPRVLGPTIPRWELGARLRQLRLKREVEQKGLAKELECSESKVQKIENGDVRTSKGDLRIIMDALGVSGEERDHFEELRRQGEQRGWWARYGQLPSRFVTYLDLEASAENMKVFEPTVVHGLLQTEDYARAVARTSSGPIADEDAERQVEIRLERQRAFFERFSPDQEPLRLWVVLDEAVLHRSIGGPEVMRHQLDYLLKLSSHQVTLQVVPFDVGGYPGLGGALTLFEFDPDLHSPIAYAEMPLGAVYAEKAEELEQATIRYEHITAAALSPERSKARVREVLDSL